MGFGRLKKQGDIMADRENFRIVTVRLMVRTNDAQSVVDEGQEAMNHLAVYSMGGSIEEIEEAEWEEIVSAVPPEILTGASPVMTGEDDGYFEPDDI
jgi:hypothetical protein